MEIIDVKGNTVKFGGKEYQCAVGKGGIRRDKKEGDGATPAGCFPIRKVLYRSDRVIKPVTSFPTQALERNDGWSDDASDESYNTQVKLPVSFSHEELWRDDNVYDLIVVLGYNDNPPVKGQGSAIFMHIAQEGYSPTEGCIALAESDLREILSNASAYVEVCISA